MGRITFWDITEEAPRQIGFARPTTQVAIRHSAYVGKHPADGKKLTITPRRQSDVLLKGGLTTADKYGSHRLEVTHSYDDFVSGALAAYTGDKSLELYPMVLLYRSRDRAEFIHSQN